MFITIYHRDNKIISAPQAYFALNVELFEELVDATSYVSGGNEQAPYIPYYYF